MGLWVSFAFGALLGVFLGVLIGRARAAARGQGARAPSEGHAPTATPLAPPRSLPPEIQHVVLDEGSANVLNALNDVLAVLEGMLKGLGGNLTRTILHELPMVGCPTEIASPHVCTPA